MVKGSNFEREICKQLSLWWTNDKRDDVFWRTSGSGARATTRNKTKQKTFGQYGDVQATDPIGQPLIDLCTIEIKRGYSKSTFADLIEDSQTANAKPCMYEKFIQQARQDHKKANSSTWLLIVKRNRRKAIIIMPNWFFRKLKEYRSASYQIQPLASIKANSHFIIIVPLDKFLYYTSPKIIIRFHVDFH